jgi:septum formation protein
MSPFPLVLASGSPRRREILEKVGFDFQVRTCEVTEEELSHTGCGASPKNLALAKARSVAQECPRRLVVGADTMVIVGDEVLGKPDGAADALRMLELLSGKTHVVVTGVALVRGERALTAEDRTTVQFRNLGRSELEWYVATGEPWGKAGAYAIQGYGSALVERIEGSYLNVVGFPLGMFVRMLEEFTGKPWLQFLGSTQARLGRAAGERARRALAASRILRVKDRMED